MTPRPPKGLSLPPGTTVATDWEADFIPLPATFEDNPAARAVLVMIVAPPLVVRAEAVNQPAEEPEQLAALLAREIAEAAREYGTRPATVAVRSNAVAQSLRKLLAARKIRVKVARKLPGVDDATRSLLAHVYGSIAPRERLRSVPETWGGWGMSGELVGALFRAAAAFHRAAPWQHVENDHTIIATRGGGHRWSVAVLGAAGEEFGLALYEHARDLADLLDSDEDAMPFTKLRGGVISLLFSAKGEQPPRMLKEIRKARWEVAGESAYPMLMILNAPGGGVTRAQFEDLVGITESIPRFVAENVPSFALASTVRPVVFWNDRANGVQCEFTPIAEYYAAPDWTKKPRCSRCGGASRLEPMSAIVVATGDPVRQVFFRGPFCVCRKCGSACLSGEDMNYFILNARDALNGRDPGDMPWRIEVMPVSAAEADAAGDEEDDGPSGEAFKQKVRKRLAGFASKASIEAGLILGDKIGADSRPDDDLGARLTKVIAPFLEGDEDLHAMQMLAAFATNAWNTTLLPVEEEKRFTEFMISTMTDNGDPDGFLRGLTNGMCAKKRELFPDDMRFVGDCDVRQDHNKFTILASVGPDYMSGPAGRRPI